MCGLFEKYKKEIENYCNNNNLNFNKAKNLPKCCGKNDIWLQYYDAEKGKEGLKNETPAPIVLKISIINGAIHFEQTEFTKKYLS